MTPERLASLKAEVDKARNLPFLAAEGMEFWRCIIALYDLAMEQQAALARLQPSQDQADQAKQDAG